MRLLLGLFVQLVRPVEQPVVPRTPLVDPQVWTPAARSRPPAASSGGRRSPRPRSRPPRRLGYAMRAAVALHIDAPPDRVWQLVSDITKMGEYSPEVIEAEWIGSATGPEVGARYRGRVKRNENWPVLVSDHLRDHRVRAGQGFRVRRCDARPARQHLAVRVPRGERRQHRADRVIRPRRQSLHQGLAPLGGFLRERRNRRDMLTTLERVKAVAEGS